LPLFGLLHVRKVVLHDFRVQPPSNKHLQKSGVKIGISVEDRKPVTDQTDWGMA